MFFLPPAVLESPLLLPELPEPETEKTVVIPIRSNPNDVGVLVDGRKVGVTPLRYEAPRGVHRTFMLVKPGYRHWILRAKVDEGVEIIANMRKL
jgi:hypothetical protein